MHKKTWGSHSGKGQRLNERLSQQLRSRKGSQAQALQPEEGSLTTRRTLQRLLKAEASSPPLTVAPGWHSVIKRACGD